MPEMTQVNAPFDISALVARYSLVNAQESMGEESAHEAPTIDAQAPESTSEGADVGAVEKTAHKPKKARKGKGRTVSAVDEAGEQEVHELSVHYASNSTVDTE